MDFSPSSESQTPSALRADWSAGLVVFLVALPLNMGVAQASTAPLSAGILAGIIGGLVVGAISQSQTSVSGSAAGLTAVVASQIATLGSFDAFLMSVVVAGILQIGLGALRIGSISSFVPSSVIRGLIAATGLIVILKQIPHLLGHDTDPEGEMSFFQPDHENTFSELMHTLFGWDVHPGAALIGLLSVVLLVVWDRWTLSKRSHIPGLLVVVLSGVALSWFLARLGGSWTLGGEHLIQVPKAQNISELSSFLKWPDFTALANPNLYAAAAMIASVASLETVLNLEAVDKLDPQRRISPSNRELIAQGIGNIAAGLIGGLPVTSAIVRSSVNINAGARTKLATMIHGGLLLVSVILLPTWLNQIPLSCLAAILLVTGWKLANPVLMRQLWNEGRYQFAPFVLTVVSIVLTDLLIGIGIGLAISLAFILASNLRRPLRSIVERHLGGDVLHIELANQVSFLNRAALSQVFNSIPRGGHILLEWDPLESTCRHASLSIL